MKGIPAAPQCGFSAAVVQILSQLAVPFKSVDVLSILRFARGSKPFRTGRPSRSFMSRASFVGGCDIVREMYQAGELATLLSSKASRQQQYDATGDTEIETAIEIPQVFKYHAFACQYATPSGHPRGSCGSLGAQPLWDRLGKKLEAERLTDIGFTASGCLGFARLSFDGGLSGRYLVSANHAEDIDEIVESHFKQGKLVERLVMILTRS